MITYLEREVWILNYYSTHTILSLLSPNMFFVHYNSPSRISPISSPSTLYMYLICATSVNIHELQMTVGNFTLRLSAFKYFGKHRLGCYSLMGNCQALKIAYMRSRYCTYMRLSYMGTNVFHDLLLPSKPTSTLRVARYDCTEEKAHQNRIHTCTSCT